MIAAILVVFISVAWNQIAEGFLSNPLLSWAPHIQGRKGVTIHMSEGSKSTDLVPVDKVNIENSAAVTGGLVGFFIGGPVIGVILAAITNYVAKKEDEDLAAEAVRGVGKTVIESVNFLTKFNNKYKVVEKAAAAIDQAA